MRAILYSKRYQGVDVNYHTTLRPSLCFVLLHNHHWVLFHSHHSSSLLLRTNKRVCGIKKIIKVTLLLHERFEASFFDAFSLVQHIQPVALHYTLATMRNHDDRLVSIPVHIVVNRIRHQFLIFTIQRHASQSKSPPLRCWLV